MKDELREKLIIDIELIIQKMIKNFNDFITDLEKHLPHSKQIMVGNIYRFCNKLTDEMSGLYRAQRKLYMKTENRIHEIWIEEMERPE